MTEDRLTKAYYLSKEVPITLKTLAKMCLGIAMLGLIFSLAATADASPRSVSVLTRTLQEGLLDFQYPMVIGMLDSAAQDSINAAIGQRVDAFRADAAIPGTEVAMARYEVRYNDNGKLSITMTFYVYRGGAHGMTYMRGLTFDLATGREYRLQDIVPYADGGREKINAAIAGQLKDRKIPLLLEFKGVKDNPDFYLAADGQPVVFFQLYELAPYVYGFLQFPLSGR